MEHDAYYRLLCELWAAGDGFLLIEHDVEILPGTVESFEKCDGDWCITPYGAPGYTAEEPLYMERALGCTRFGPRLLADLPNFMVDLPVRDWRRLDCEIHPRLQAAGFEPCMHWPAVKHHHVYPGQGCACGEEHQ